MNTWDEIRIERNRLLKDSDWTQVSDAPDSIDQWSWKVYRFNLRNLPQKYNNAEDVVFPEPPPAEQNTTDIFSL